MSLTRRPGRNPEMRSAFTTFLRPTREGSSSQRRLSHRRLSHRLKVSLAAFTTAVLAVGVVAVGIAAPADATTPAANTITSSVSCDSNTGWTVAWSVANNQATDATVTASSNTAVVAVATTIPANQTVIFAQSVSGPVDKTLELTSSWTSSDAGTVTATNSGSVTKAQFAKGCGGTPTPPPAASCLPASAVSYTYTPATNSGTITVATKAGSTNVLCKTLYVTATSWTYDRASTWPQTLDKVQKLTVSAAGKYDYSAPVSCGQGDIYASTTAPIVPTAHLLGAEPWEQFLSSLGFATTTPGNTYIGQDYNCYTTVTPVAPTVTPVTKCGTYGSVVAATTSGINYSVTYDRTAGTYSVIATPTAGNHLPGNVPSITFTGSTGAYYSCTTPPTKPESVTTITTSEGAPNCTMSTVTVDTVTTTTTWVFNSSTNSWVRGTDIVTHDISTRTLTDAEKAACAPVVTPTKPITVQASGCDTVGSVVLPTTTGVSYVLTGGTGQTGAWEVTATPQDGYKFVGPQTVVFTGDLGTYPDTCVAIPASPTAGSQTCLADETSATLISGFISVTPVTGVSYTIHNTASASTANDVTITTGTGVVTTEVVPGTYLVTATALAGYAIKPPASWPAFVIAPAPGTCEQLGTHALADGSAQVSSNQSCSAAGTMVNGTITVDRTGGLDYYIGTTKLTADTTSVAPGTYTVTGVPSSADFTWDGAPWVLTVAGVATACADLDTLALHDGDDAAVALASTGFSGGQWYVAAALVLLVLGGAFMFWSRRRVDKTEF